MSLKDALSKRPQIAPEVAPNQPQPLPSLNNHIQPYGDPSRPVSNSELEKRAFATKQAERVVTIGESVILKGDISDCDKAEICGQFEGTIVASSIQISEGGSVKGTIECEELSIAGSVDGKVTSTKTLEIKATGKLTGEILYEEFLVTAGGEISGTIEKNHPTTPGVVSG
jgi:cytoskeletal protein CcmA (bactofilin family)